MNGFEMVDAKSEQTRYGIGEWYGKPIESILPTDKLRYAKLHGVKNEPCLHHPAKMLCNKSGGVCSFVLYHKKEDGSVFLDRKTDAAVTLCPIRFWQKYIVFREVGSVIMQTDKPTLIKEIAFLQKIDHLGSKTNETVGRLDMILAKMNQNQEIVDWCALEMQAVYFSGLSMNAEFRAIEKEPNRLLFPTSHRRPDFRSSGPKRLMPQLQIKVPALRRWGKKMAVIIDRPFFESIAPMKRVFHISNADIAWFVVDYDGPEGEIRIAETILTTLESSVDGLTAGEPISKDAFETLLASYIKRGSKKMISLS